jgi:hypothetical protein
MTPYTKKERAEGHASLLGIRISIWEAVLVMLCAGVGALAGGSIYSPETVFGAFVGALTGPTTLRRFLLKKPLSR